MRESLYNGPIETLQAVNGHCCGAPTAWHVMRGKNALSIRAEISDPVPKKTSNRDLSGNQLTKATAEKVFGWKNVHKNNRVIGKKRDKAGRWWKAKVPDYANDQRRRVYVSGGEGFLSIFQQIDADHYQALAKIPTARGARTSLFVPELNRLYVAVPHRGPQRAEVRVYEPQP